MSKAPRGTEASSDSEQSKWLSSLTLWEGPDTLTTSDESDSAFWFGWQVLRLAILSEGPRVLAARSIYADPGKYQPIGILRAVYWHSHQSGYNPGMAPIAARFVEVPMAKALQWIATFDNLPVKPQRSSEASAPIRSVRVEWDYASSAFELRWQGGELERSSICQAWHVIWNEMGVALESLPQSLDIEEDWRLDLTRLDDPPFTTDSSSSATAYNLEAYPPLERQHTDRPRNI